MYEELRKIKKIYQITLKSTEFTERRSIANDICQIHCLHCQEIPIASAFSIYRTLLE